MDDRRKNNRTRFRKRVVFGVDKFNYPGYSEDISLSGIRISSIHYLPAGTKVRIGFGQEEKEIEVRLKGKVRWALAAAEGEEGQRLHYMGIDLTWHDENYVQFLADLIEQRRADGEPFIDRRADFRYKEKITVIFDDREETLEQLTENISKGGLFICTDRPMSPGTALSLRMVLPEIMEDVRADGEVKYATDVATAKIEQRPPGMGIQFTGFNPEDKRRFIEYLEKLAKEEMKKKKGS
jgi:type IV pilus assembly protein PilZ